MNSRRWSGFLFVAMLCWVGCGPSASGPVDMGGEEGTQVAVLVEELNEAKGDSKKMEALFASKPTAADAKKFNQLSFYVSGKPTVNGTTATCKVKVEKQDGTPLDDQEWTFEKTSTSWKIKSAVLP